MANPPITIGSFTDVPAPGSPIRSDWSQHITHAVAGESLVAIEATGSSNIDATSLNTFSTWLSIVNVVPPSWARSVVVDVVVQGIQTIVADVDYSLRTVCNANGSEGLYSGFFNRYTSYRISEAFSITPGVGNSVVLQARRVGGTGGLRYAAGSSIVGAVRFVP